MSTKKPKLTLVISTEGHKVPLSSQSANRGTYEPGPPYLIPIAGGLSRGPRKPIEHNNAPVRIHDGNSLFVRTSPGGKTYSRDKEGAYSYRFFVLGGCGGGKCTAEDIARYLATHYKNSHVESILTALGWSDVLSVFSRLKVEEISSS